MLYEEWRRLGTIKGYDLSNYEVSSFGRVRTAKDNSRNKAGTTLSGTQSADGYWKVTLSAVDGRSWSNNVHILVAWSFLGPPPSPHHHQVNHIDFDPSNNQIKNLEWVTPRENLVHSYKMDGGINSNKSSQKEAKETIGGLW